MVSIMVKSNPLSALKRHIKSKALDEGPKKPKAFLLWYAEARAPNHKRYYTEYKDGQIDLVLEGEKSIIMVQGKYRKADGDDLKLFGRALKEWESKETFERWCENEVDNPSSRRIYRDTYRKIGKKRVFWEFVSLSRFDKKKLQYLKPTKATNFYPRIISPEDLEFYFSLYAVGASYVEPLEVEIEGNVAPFFDPEGRGYETQICIMKIPSLVKAIKKLDDPELLFSRNVRLEKPGIVNENIRKTYKTEPGNFFYGNNGIHILCTRAPHEGRMVEIHNPAVINGGQTIRTLLDSAVSSGALLARITSISESEQIHMHRFLDDIIFRSNNNNIMKPWDLRSNDKIQVDIARELYARKIFYGRKSRQWTLQKAKYPSFNDHVDSVELAQIMAICDNDIGPAELKGIGKIPLFEKKAETVGGLYEKLFQNFLSEMDRNETRIRMYLLIKKKIKKTKGIPKKYKSFKNASRNYVLGTLWRLIENENPEYPLDLSEEAFTPIITGMAGSMFKEFIGDIKKGIANQNDIFRNDEYWKRAIRLSKPWQKDVRKALG